MVIGCPGGGKSTFSRKLHEITGLPLYHLDMMYWNADRTTVDKAVFLQRLTEAICTDEWIIDGNYRSTIELRLSACDTVFFLDYPVEVCLEGVASRKGKPRSDMPWVENGEDETFLQFIKSFNADCKPEVVGLLKKYMEKTIHVFHSRDEAEAFLNRLSK